MWGHWCPGPSSAVAGGRALGMGASPAAGPGPRPQAQQLCWASPPCSSWSLARWGRTCVPCMARQTLKHCAAGEALRNSCFFLCPASRHGEGDGTPLQGSCPETPRDGEPGGLQPVGSLRVRHNWATSLSFTFHFPALEKEMATHSSVLAWRIPGMEEPGGWPAVYGVAQSRTRLKRLSSSISLG